MITYEQFAQIEIKAGKILSAEKIEGSEKLLKLMVDFGLKPTREEAEAGSPELRDTRQIISGIAKYFPDAQTIVGKTAMFVTNLEPRTIFGHESNGMLFAVSTPEGAFSLLEPNETIPAGTRAK